MTRDAPNVRKRVEHPALAREDGKIRASAPEFTIAVHGSVLVLVWHGRTTLQGVQAARQLSGTPAVELALVLVEKVTHAPDPLTSRELKMWAAEFSPRRVAVVFEGQGFAAAAVRAVIVGIRALKTARGTSELFASISAAAAWLKKHHSATPGVADLPSYVETLRTARR